MPSEPDKIALNAASAAGFGGIHVRDASGNQTGTLVWDVGNNYWVGGLTIIGFVLLFKKFSSIKLFKFISMNYNK